MCGGAHVILYSQDAEADRAFIADVLRFPHVDAGYGWLIFKLPPAEVAVHPTDGAPQHEFYLMCDGLNTVLAELAAAGVETTRPIAEERWGGSPQHGCQAGPSCRCTNRCTPSRTACDSPSSAGASFAGLRLPWSRWTFPTRDQRPCFRVSMRKNVVMGGEFP